jgi:ATPase subunit of ABC transporter with duplicated ATPase domains
MATRLAAPGRHAALRGRADECTLLDGLVGDIRRNRGRALVLRGEAGIGKTALLQYLIESAADLTVVRAVGVESEIELAYASLHQVCAPLLSRLDRSCGERSSLFAPFFGLFGGWGAVWLLAT